jgi:hypothetical protein
MSQGISNRLAFYLRGLGKQAACPFIKIAVFSGTLRLGRQSMGEICNEHIR